MRNKRVVLALCVMAAALVAGAVVASSQVTLLVLDVPRHEGTLVVKRSKVLGMRLVETETSLCRRQRVGSPLHSVMLPATFCPFALVTSEQATGSNVLLRLPVIPGLRSIAE